MTLRTALVGLMERRKQERRAPAAIMPYDDAVRDLRAMKYTGKTVTDWAEGVEKKIEIPNPVIIEVTR